jgi:hypothetical protein
MRRIRKANISFISLVPAGANKLAPVYKADGSIELGTLIKVADGFDEQGELTAVVYAPEHRDSQGDIADASVIKDAAYDFISNGAKVDIKHDGKAVGRDRARVGETFLVQKTDERFHGWKDREDKPVDLTGAWATVIKIDDPELRKKYRSGEWAGVSMGGTAIVEQEKAGRFDEMLEKLAKFLNPPTNPQPEPEPDMDETKMLKAISDGFSTMTAELVKALKPELPKAPEPKPEEKAPIFKGRYDDPRALELHQRETVMFQLRKGTDFSDPASLQAYREQVVALKAAWVEEDKAAGIETKVSKVGPTVGTPQLPLAEGTIEEQTDYGLALAKAANARAGFKPVAKAV